MIGSADRLQRVGRLTSLGRPDACQSVADVLRLRGRRSAVAAPVRPWWNRYVIEEG